MVEKVKAKKNRPHMDSNQQSFASKVDALSVKLCGHKTISVSIKNYIFGGSLDEKRGSEKDATTEGLEPPIF